MLLIEVHVIQLMSVFKVMTNFSWKPVKFILSPVVYYKQVPVLVDIVHNNYLLQKLCEHASHNSPGNAQGLAVFQNQNTHP